MNGLGLACRSSAVTALTEIERAESPLLEVKVQNRGITFRNLDRRSQHTVSAHSPTFWNKITHLPTPMPVSMFVALAKWINELCKHCTAGFVIPDSGKSGKFCLIGEICLQACCKQTCLPSPWCKLCFSYSLFLIKSYALTWSTFLKCKLPNYSLAL